MTDNLAKKSFWSTFWSLTDQIMTKMISFIIGIILARLLTPADFGLIGMLMVFILLSDTFIESGILNAIIRKVNRTPEDFSTGFFINLAMAVLAYTILALCSPLIASFYGEPILSKLLLFVGLNLILYSLCIVPNAIILSSFNTKTLAKVNFVANLISGILAITTAYCHFGVWALVIQTISCNAIKVIGYWTATKWLPSLSISKSSLAYFWSYGSKSLAVGFLGTLFNNLYNLLIGKFFTKIELGLYTRASQFGQVPTSIISSTFQKASVATFAEVQNDTADYIALWVPHISLLWYRHLAWI